MLDLVGVHWAVAPPPDSGCCTQDAHAHSRLADTANAPLIATPSLHCQYCLNYWIVNVCKHISPFPVNRGFRYHIFRPYLPNIYPFNINSRHLCRCSVNSGFLSQQQPASSANIWNWFVSLETLKPSMKDDMHLAVMPRQCNFVCKCLVRGFW